MPSVLDIVKPTVDDTISRLASTSFVVDPIAGEHLSRITSIISSAYKRHGAIIEVALFHAIAQRNELEADNKVRFFVNRNASAYVESYDVKSRDGLAACLNTSVPYREDGAAHELDIVYFDHHRRCIVALEVKRGNGQFDRGKRDSMIKSALAVRTLLASYATFRGWPAGHVESRILAYYGVPKFPAEIYLRGDELDTFIAPGIRDSVEEVNDYFRRSLLGNHRSLRVAGEHVAMSELYGTIYADPPWYFKNYSARGTGRAAVSFYDVMSLNELKQLPVSQYAADDCALFLWAIDPMLPQAIELMTAWGFSFKTVAFNWVKANKKADLERLSEASFFTGLGYWTRANPELCLLGTRGKPKRLAKDVRRLLVSKRREHSRKPDEVYGRIEQLVSGPYLELFSRQRRDGWDAVGDQVSDIDDKYERRQPSRISGQEDVSGRVTARYAAE